MSASEDSSLAALGKIKHIVVLMMENRSFDQMLGYLTTRRYARGSRASPAASNPDGRTAKSTRSSNGAPKKPRSIRLRIPAARS